jgi:RND family efflux transporter MFP subunit
MTQTKSTGATTTKSLLISAIIIILGLLLAWIILNTEPEAQREGATRKTAMLVETTAVETGDFTPVIKVMGTVMPSREVQLQAQVNGQVQSLSDAFIPGTIVSQGDNLLQIDPQDYQNKLSQSQSQLQQAQTALQIEMGEQIAAQKDYDGLGRDLDEPQKSLVLRKPQLANAQAAVSESQAMVDQAQLNLARTQITVPFDAQIQNTYVNLGSQVSSGTILADLVGVKTYWIEASVPVSQSPWINSPSNAQEQTVTIRDRLSWPDSETRQGRILSLIGQVDNESRMARLLLAVDDPLAIEDQQLPQLTIGAYVSCLIPTKQLNDVARIERQYVRKNDTIWIMHNQQLTIKNLNVVFRDQQYVYVKDTLQANEQIITTDLSRISEGAAVRLDTQQSDGK